MPSRGQPRSSFTPSDALASDRKHLTLHAAQRAAHTLREAIMKRTGMGT
jgi:hypothetical protein